MLVLPKSPIWLKITVLVVIEKIVILCWNIGFLRAILFWEFLIKYFKYIEILYEKLFAITKYYPISNSNVNTVVTDINNIESSTDSDSSNEVYKINNNNNNRNNIINNSSINDDENRNINISDSENNTIVINNIVNRSIGENRVNIIN